MNRYTLFFSLLLLFGSCNKSDTQGNIKYINGYWEIDRVEMADGTERKYNFNQTIDFFEVIELTGIRKKVQPKLDGNFNITQDSETFTLKTENDSLNIYYKTSQWSWKETILSIKENQMIIKNKDGNIYFYKRYQKLDL